MNGKGYVIGLLLIMTGACQEALEDRYVLPGQNSLPTIDKLFTRLLDDNRVRPSYWEVSTMVNWHIGVYSQTVGFLNTDFIYQQNEQYIQERWNDFYRPSANGAGVLAQFREMERLYNAMNAADQANWVVYMHAANIVVLDQATRLVDLWGDIPFSEAGMLVASGEVEYPRFDAGASVYQTAISRLSDAAAALGSLKPAAAAAKLFAQQDLLLHGDLRQWQRYANALRLRLLMRLSTADGATVVKEIQDMLGDRERFPLPGDAGDYAPNDDDVLLTPLSTYTDDLHAAFADWTNYPAPYYLLEHVLKPVDDPRIPVMFDRYGAYSGNAFIPNTGYNGMPADKVAIDQEATINKHAILDSATFLLNNPLPGVVMTVAEVDFLKAEAFARWGGGDAGLAYGQGVVHSIQFYYYLNGLNNRGPHPPVPSAQQLQEFVNRDDVRLRDVQADRLKQIWTQKWAHFGFLQCYQAWAELRRTNYPQLDFLRSAAPGNELPPSRLTYPLSEKTYNPHYAEVAGRDTRSVKIFWDND